MNKTFLKSILIGALIFLLFSAQQCSKKSDSMITTSATELVINEEPINYKFNGDYASHWKTVDSLNGLGLYKSAYIKVTEIYSLARKEKNYPQVLKAQTNKLKYNSYLDEDDYINAIAEMDSLTEHAEFPLKQLSHLLTARIYQGFYNANQYTIMNRTSTEDFANNDVRTWDLRKIAQTITYHYVQSTSEVDKLKLVNIEDFKEILTYTGLSYGNTLRFRPTLYDFLAHESLSFFQTFEFGISESDLQFSLDNSSYLSNNEDFISIKASNNDTLSNKFYATKLFQDLTKSHMKDEDPVVLLDVTHQRLTFMLSNSTLDNKDELYLNALDFFISRYKTHESSTEFMYQKAHWYYANSDFNSNEESKKFGKKTAHAICEKAAKLHPSSYGVTQCNALQREIEKSVLSISFDQIMTPSKEHLYSISFQNIDKVYFRLLEMPRDYTMPSHYSKGISHPLEQIENDGKLLKTWIKQVPNNKDFENHTFEMVLEPLKYGAYCIIASPDSTFKTNIENIQYGFFQASNFALSENRKSNDHWELIVNDRNTGKPVSEAKVNLYTHKYNKYKAEYEYIKHSSFVTDSEGKGSYKSSNYLTLYPEVVKGDDYLFDKAGMYFSESYSQEEYPTFTTHFFLDRKIYRPGQKVYFKGIVTKKYKGVNTVISNTKNNVTFYDVNYQKVANVSVTTNEYGSFSGEFTAPSTGMNGQMRLTDNYSSVYFRVEEYKRPKFEVDFLPIEGVYKLNNEIKVTGNAVAYAGNQIDGATVKYRVVRSANFPYWCWYRWGFMPKSATKEVASGELETDEEGKFEVIFNATEDKNVNLKYSPTYSYIIYADVTDINGETRSGQTNVYVGKNAMNLNLNLTAEIDKENLESFTISSTNLNGRKVPATVKYTVFKLLTPDKVFRQRGFTYADIKTLSQPEFESRFPQDIYDNENKVEKYAVEKSMISAELNTEKNDTVFFKPNSQWKQGHYKVVATSIDEFGEEVYVEKYFTVYDSRNDKPHNTDVLWTKAVKTTIQPGEFAKLLVASKDKIEVTYKLVKSGRVIEEKIISINNEQKTLTFDVKEDDRGGFTVVLSTIRNERFYTQTIYFSVPYTNKQLNVTLETYRNKMLPGSKEEWKVKISGEKGDKVAAEMVATMYDASLDEFASNYYSMYIDYSRRYYYQNFNTQFRGFGATSMLVYNRNYYNYYSSSYQRQYPSLNMFGFHPYYYLRGPGGRNEYLSDMYFDDADMSVSANFATTEVAEMEESNADGLPPPPPSPGVYNVTTTAASGSTLSRNTNGRKDEKQQEFLGGEVGGSGETGKQVDLSNVKARSNFSETAFFLPHLETNSKGEIIFSFTMPESLTKWKFMSLAHTKDLSVGMTTKEVVTQKDLMVIPNAPRFFREKDKITLSTKISSLADEDLNGQVQLFLFDALTNQPIDGITKNSSAQKTFSVPTKKSTSVEWEIEIPEGVQAITYKMVAQAGSFSDGEEMTLPVLSNRMLVTESIPLYINKKGSKTFQLKNLINSGESSTLRHERITVEFTSNPAWYAIQSLPYLMEYPYECAEQTFSRYYANSIASHVANSNPKIKAVFDSWKEGSKDAFLSNLEKNQELKALFLEETPWVLQAKSESENKKRVGLLFDLHRMDKELDKALKKIEESQLSSGGFPWFKGMKANRYITQHILCGMGHLNKMGIINSKKHLREWRMIRNAITYLDNEMVDDYEWLLKHHADIHKLTYIGNSQLQYMYARSFFDTKMDGKVKEAHDYYLKMAKKYWLSNPLQTQAMLALTLERLEPEGKVQDDIMKSLTEIAIHSDEMGMYYKDNLAGYYWYNSQIETQAMLIEAFDEVAKNEEAVEELKVWLLKQKQTTHWKTTKATAEACYALLLRGTDILSNDEIVEVKLGDMIVDPGKTEAGTGYYKKAYAPEVIKPEMGNVTVTRKTTGVSWGGLYWQYFEDLDKIKTHETPLTIHKKLFKVQLNKDGEFMTPIEEGSALGLGDKIRVRIEIHTDRDLEYVHLKDMRAAGFEPINVVSRYKWQDGLGYYESTKDASTNFFMDFLAKGVYVFEYDLRVFHKGNFSNGITNMQCMYAPEFSSHSEGVRVKVGE